MALEFPLLFPANCFIIYLIEMVCVLADAATGMYAELIYRYAGCDNEDLCNSNKLRGFSCVLPCVFYYAVLEHISTSSPKVDK